MESWKSGLQANKMLKCTLHQLFSWAVQLTNRYELGISERPKSTGCLMQWKNGRALPALIKGWEHYPLKSHTWSLWHRHRIYQCSFTTTCQPSQKAPGIGLNVKPWPQDIYGKNMRHLHGDGVNNADIKRRESLCWKRREVDEAGEERGWEVEWVNVKSVLMHECHVCAGVCGRVCVCLYASWAAGVRMRWRELSSRGMTPFLPPTVHPLACNLSPLTLTAA